MALPQAIDICISMLRLAPQCFAFTSSIVFVYSESVLVKIFIVESTAYGGTTLLSGSRNVLGKFNVYT